MNRLSQPALMKIVFALIGLIIGLLDYFIKQPDLSGSIFKAFVVTAILFIGELVFETREAQKRDKETHDTFLRRNRNLTGTLLSQLNTELEEAVKVQEHHFVVDHPTLAILSYDTFWKLLVEQIGTRKLTVYTIHSCAMDVWVEHPLTNSLLNRQRDFCQKGGKIVRILCDRSPVLREPVRSAAQSMVEAGIEVAYYNLSSQRIADHTFAWDYAIVDETGDAAIWDSFASTPGGIIGEAVYSNRGEYKNKNLRELWKTVRAFSHPIPSETPNAPISVG